MDEFLAALDAAEPTDRATAADAVLDWLGGYTREEGDAVGGALLRAATAECDPRAYEAQTHALAELAEQGLLPTATIRAAADLPATDDVSVAEYLAYLRALADGDG